VRGEPVFCDASHCRCSSFASRIALVDLHVTILDIATAMDKTIKTICWRVWDFAICLSSS
jgi:hypothetical protein